MKCIVCGDKFEPKRNKKQKCCSRKCNAIYQNKLKAENFKVPKCKTCGKETRRQSKAKYCSPKCQHEASKGAGNHRWKGGRKKHSQGYIYIYMPEHKNCDCAGYMLEHRVIIENNIGRLLTKKECVHHINGIKDDNRTENLILLRSSAEHLKEHNYFLEEQKKAKKQRQSS